MVSDVAYAAKVLMLPRDKYLVRLYAATGIEIGKPKEPRTGSYLGPPFA
jgi:hypothetical protein